MTSIFAIPFPALSQNNTIKIGFLIRDKNDLASKQAAELAIAHANARGGYQGRSFELIIKSCDGPWGVGSKQAVSLVYEDEVSLIVDALDGRNAHLAEQVTAKSHMVLISTQSSDPTLSRAYVPWYFRIVPDDKQQAAFLAKEIYQNKKFKKVALIALDDYDGKMSLEALADELKKSGNYKPEQLTGLSENELIQKVIKNPWEAIVLSGSAANAAQVIEKILAAKPDLKIYAFQNVFNFTADMQPALTQKIKYARAIDQNDKRWNAFQKAYQQKYAKNPGPAQAFVYDGIMVAIDAIRKNGPDPEALRKGFKSSKYPGITGEIKFGELGNREIELVLSN